MLFQSETRCYGCTEDSGVVCTNTNGCAEHRQLRTARTNILLATVATSIIDCRVANEDAPIDEPRSDQLTIEEQRLSVEHLMPVLLALCKQGFVTKEDIKLAGQYVNTPFALELSQQMIQRAVERVESGSYGRSRSELTARRCEQSVARIHELMTSVEMRWLIDSDSELITVPQNSDEDQNGGDLTVGLASHARSLLGEKFPEIRIQSKSCGSAVIDFLLQIANVSPHKGNKQLLKRLPLNKFLLVLNGQQIPEIIAAHAAYQYAAQVIWQNPGNESALMKEILRLLPESVIFTMHTLLQLCQGCSVNPDFVVELNLMFTILDRFSKRTKAVQVTKEAMRKRLDERSKIIMDAIVSAEAALG